MLNFNKKKYVSFDNLKSFNGLLQSSLKEKIDGYKSEIDTKVHKKFNELSGKVQTDSEVIDARKGEASLRAKIDVIDEDIKNVTSQLEHIVNIDVKNFGAKGDGVTDDTLAIQNAINSIETGNIFFPKGEYVISECFIENKNNFSLIGQNAKIKLKNNTNNKKMITFYNCEDIKVVGLSFDGNRSNQTIIKPSNGVEGKDATENCPIILLENVIVGNISNCSFENSQGDGIQLDIMYYNQSNTYNRECKNITIKNNVFKRCGRNGVSVVHADDVNIINNKFDDMTLFSTSIACAIDVEPNPFYSFITKNIIIENNIINNCLWGILVCNSGKDNALMNNVNLKNNIINNCSTGIQMLNTNHNEDNKDFIINNNHINNSGYGLSIDSSDNIEITNNTILNCKLLKDNRGDGITINMYNDIENRISRNILIANNVINKTDSNGLELNNVDDVKILNNSITNVGLLNDTYPVLLFRTIKNLMVINNNFKSEKITILAPSIDQELTNIDVYNNNMSNRGVVLSSTNKTNVNVCNNFVGGVIEEINISQTSILKNKLQPADLILPNKDNLGAGEISFSSSFSNLTVQDGFGLKKVALFRSGTTNERPQGVKRQGELYFDITLNKFLFWNNAWFDMGGSQV